jgi:hypothetical protein
MRSNGNSSAGRNEQRRGDDRGERRWNDRFAHSAVGTIFYQGARFSTSCYVLDVSTGGARIELDLDDWVNPVSSSRSLPGAFRLVIHSLGFEADCQVVWRDKASLGVRFVGKLRTMPRQFRRLRAF